MSFPLEELSETARRSDRFLWKSQLSGESRGSSIPGTGESDRQPSRRVVLGWDYQHVGSRNRQFGNHRAPEIRFGGSIDQGGSRMGGQRSWLRGAALIGFVGLAWAPCTWAQSQAGASSLSGFGFMPQSVMGGSTQGGLGVVAVPSFMGVGTQQGTGLGSANAMMMNPLGLNYALRTGNSDDGDASRAFHALDAAADAGPGQRTDQRGSSRGSGSHRS